MKKILIIENSKIQLEMLKNILISAGYDIITANTGAEGINSAYENQPDLVISGVVLSDINGHHLCRLLKYDDITKNIPIILLTSFSKKLEKFWGIKAGADAYVVKDSGFNGLVEEVNKLFVSKPPAKENRSQVSKHLNLRGTSIQARIDYLLDHALMESVIINEFRNFSEFIPDIPSLNKGIFSLLSSLIDYNVAGIFFNNRDDNTQKIINLSINDLNINEENITLIKNDFFKTIFPGNSDDSNNSYYYNVFEKNINKPEVFNNLSQFQYKNILPIVYENQILGGICIYQVKQSSFLPIILKIIFAELKILMRILWLHSETKYLSVTDELTGLYNRRYFRQILEAEFERAKRSSNALSVALLDIDHFKNINDTYGHQFGDKVLSEISGIIRKSFRKTDIVARYGGEEIIIVLPETNLKSAHIPIEKLRKVIEEYGFTYNGTTIQVTVSIGLADYNLDVTNESELIKRADDVLYKAKHDGRNRVELYEKPVEACKE